MNLSCDKYFTFQNRYSICVKYYDESYSTQHYSLIKSK